MRAVPDDKLWPIASGCLSCGMGCIDALFSQNEKGKTENLSPSRKTTLDRGCRLSDEGGGKAEGGKSGCKKKDTSSSRSY